jgi:hypothetical protein
MNALTQARKNYDWYDVDTETFPQYSGFPLDLNNYEAVIFYTALNNATVPAAVLDNLEAYLQGGGKVIFSGQHLWSNLDDSDFINAYLGCEETAATGNSRVLHGVTGTNWDGDMLLLQGSGGANNQQVPFPLFVSTGAEGVLYTGNNQDDLVGFEYGDGDWLTFFAGFSLEAAGGAGTSLSLQEILEYLLYEYFGLADDVSGNTPQTLPQKLTLTGYPNPFNPETTLEFALPAATELRLRIFDLRGALVAEPAAGIYPAGVHQLSWSAGNLSSGMYFAVLQTTGGTRITRKLMLLK